MFFGLIFSNHKNVDILDFFRFRIMIIHILNFRKSRIFAFFALQKAYINYVKIRNTQLKTLATRKINDIMVKLEKFRIDDFGDLTNWIQTKEELIQFAGAIFQFPLKINQIEAYLSDRKRNVFKVMYSSDEQTTSIGMAELYDFSANTNKLARVLIGEKSIRGNGIGTELMRQLVKYSFEKDNKEAVILNVYEWNLSAIKCYEKVGFLKTDRDPKVTTVDNKKWRAIEMKMERVKQ